MLANIHASTYVPYSLLLPYFSAIYSSSILKLDKRLLSFSCVQPNIHDHSYWGPPTRAAPEQQLVRPPENGDSPMLGSSSYLVDPALQGIATFSYGRNQLLFRALPTRITRNPIW